MAASPTPPQPNTATVSPRLHLAGVHGGAEAGHDAAAESPAASGRAAGSTLARLARGHEGLLGEGADAQRRATAACRRGVIFCGGVERWRSSTRAGPGGTSGTRRTRPAR